MTDFGRRAIPPDHASRHENAGADEIDAALLDNRLNYVDRGDPSSWDWNVNAFTANGSWQVFDVSNIVPANAKYVNLRVLFVDDAVGSEVRFGKNGNSNDLTVLSLFTQVAAVQIAASGIVPCDSDRKLQFKGINGPYTTLSVFILGWFI